MTDKTPEELATEHAIDNASEAYEALRKAYLAGYEAGRPKWVKASEIAPKEYDKYLGRFEVKADFWAIPLIVFYWRTVIDTAHYFDQNGNALGVEYLRLIEYTELPPIKED